MSPCCSCGAADSDVPASATAGGRRRMRRHAGIGRSRPGAVRAARAGGLAIVVAKEEVHIVELGLVAKGARAVGRGVEGAAADGVVDDAALAAAEDIGADDDGGRDGEEEDEAEATALTEKGVHWRDRALAGGDERAEGACAQYRDADDDSVELWPPSSVDVVVAVGLADVVEVEVDIVSASGVESRKPAGGRWAGVLS
ncbi:hypothetical protein POSPLADRAFT_1050326 [Postia placenta MAD-698-R-SB12]|uniref:Uncharacterized protein n=1 Tax=Postia placenta MAD-698-R-SB12 TaxID=670580 RepID=A0A1X6MKF4_9APHY|nr:hypothetical protein POSPLADRAFT_1050326 [Postia placenta MAD-698-R-SB12]OSX56874.1 hypothetical protein POSPLADRAFT_1050326 [Postia placenta MAD-698-R-SB12]